MDNELLVKTIRDLCKKNNIPVSQLENELNFGAGLISRWSKSSPSIDKIVDIADYFHVSLDEVVGRTNKLSDDFLSVLTLLTNDNKIIWNNYDDNTKAKQHYGLEVDPNEFSNQEEYNSFFDYHREVSYYAKSNNGYISIYAMYCNFEITKPNEIKLFIQPDINSELIPQPYETKQLQPLWIKILSALGEGKPDEVKAEDFKQQLITHRESALLSSFSHYIENTPENDDDINELLANEKVKKTLIELNTPELQQLIKTFSDPKMAQAMKSAQKFINYFSDIKKAKESNNE